MTTLSKKRQEFAKKYIAKNVKEGMSRTKITSVYRKAWKEARKKYPLGKK